MKVYIVNNKFYYTYSDALKASNGDTKEIRKINFSFDSLDGADMFKK